MPRPQKRGRERFAELSETQLHFISDGLWGDPGAVDSGELWFAEFKESRELWLAVRQELLPAWIRAHPGTRPREWWNFEAPRLPERDVPMRWKIPKVWFFVKDLIVPRRRVGGTGVTMAEHTANEDLLSTDTPAWVPEFDYGIPKHWFSFDLADPPRYESQAEYLRRHDLMSIIEERRLRPD